MTGRYRKKPCTHCPFRTDVRPFLHPERAAGIALQARYRWAEFTCHETLEYDEDGQDTVIGAKAKTCAGFLTMQLQESNRPAPEGFTPADNIYRDPGSMIVAYSLQWKKERSR